MRLALAPPRLQPCAPRPPCAPPHTNLGRATLPLPLPLTLPLTRFLIDVASSVPLDTIMSLAFWAAGQGVDAAPPSPPAHFDIEDTLYRADPRCGGQADSGTNFLKLIRLIRLLKLARFLKLGARARLH